MKGGGKRDKEEMTWEGDASVGGGGAMPELMAALVQVLGFQRQSINPNSSFIALTELKNADGSITTPATDKLTTSRTMNNVDQ